MNLKYIKRIFYILVIFMIAYFILGEKLLKSDIPPDEYRCEEFLGQWYQKMDNGEKKSIRIPGKYDVKRNESMTIETVLPDNIPNDSYMSFRSAK